MLFTENKLINSSRLFANVKVRSTFEYNYNTNEIVVKLNDKFIKLIYKRK